MDSHRNKACAKTFHAAPNLTVTGKSIAEKKRVLRFFLSAVATVKRAL